MVDPEHQADLIDGQLMREMTDTNAWRRFMQLVDGAKQSLHADLLNAGSWDEHNKIVGGLEALDVIAHMPDAAIERADDLKKELHLAS